MSSAKVFFRVSLIMVFLIILSTLAFMKTENLSPMDSLWLTVITMATVGYGDYVPRTVPGRLTAMLIIVGGVGLYTYILSTLFTGLLEGQLAELKESMDRIIERLDRIDQRLGHQSALLLALQHNSEVARAERESLTMAVARLSGQVEEVNKLCDDILKKVNNLVITQDFIKENIKDQALDITLLKKIISY